MALLEIDQLSLSFGGLRAIAELDLEVAENEIVSIIGPNGAGKSSVFNVISGVYLPTEGDVRLGGQSIVGYKPHTIARKGIARTFQSLRLFQNMTVKENVKAATYGNTRQSSRSFACPAPGAKNARSTRSRPRCCRSSASGSPAIAGISLRTCCPTRIAGGWRSRARSRRGRGC
jgi:ABC-type branched-subunit amino acid transport system ATPase component